jgi:hypothetical protein
MASTLSTSIQRLHVKHINPLHLPQDLESLQTSTLIQIRRNGTRLGAGREEVFFCSDF